MVKSYVEVVVMMPPICEICSREFNPDKEGGLIYFKKTEKGKAFEEKAKKKKSGLDTLLTLHGFAESTTKNLKS